MRLERLADERQRNTEKIADIVGLAEDEQRDLDENEQAHLERYRSRGGELEAEIVLLADELERSGRSRDVSALLRGDTPAAAATHDSQLTPDGPVYRNFAQYARDELIVRYPLIASAAAGGPDAAPHMREAAIERLATLKRVVNTTTTQVAGLLPPTHISTIMDLISMNRPVVASGRQVPLTTGSLTYPKIDQRPQALKQTAEKTEGGTANMQVSMQTLTADTYIGGGDLSWQTITWSNPDALMLWFDLAAEAYSRATEVAGATELDADSGGTSTVHLGTAGTDDFNAWRNSIASGLAAIDSQTGGRSRTDTLYLSLDRYYQLAGLGSANVVQVSPIGGLDLANKTGNFMGLQVVGSFGFPTTNRAILGDASAYLVGENPGAPVELRAVEPTIGGMQVGVIGAFKSKVFDSNRFIHIA
jgi:HK97 family phage major capsid protein